MEWITYVSLDDWRLAAQGSHARHLPHVDRLFYARCDLVVIRQDGMEVRGRHPNIGWITFREDELVGAEAPEGYA